MPYRLSQSLSFHQSDVRDVASPSPTLVLSASRDTTAISWLRSDTSSSFTPAHTYRAGNRYVNSVTYLPASSDAPQGYLVSGGQDAIINVFVIGSTTGEPAYSLLGHTENVCALDATPAGTIVSGSWDKTARVWKDYKLAYELKGHDQAVWAVVAVDDDQFLTGSADKTIRLWNQHKSMHTFTGHTDAVRGLALFPEIGFVSCSNDSEIRVWTLGGDAIYTLSGHTSFVYSVAVLPTGEIVSGGEDRSVRVWRDEECIQTIVHPAISVWAVSVMPNGDIVSGCSDKVVRVFSASEERWASAEDLKAYEDQVSNQTLPSQQVGDVKKTDLPGPEALQKPGNKEGQVVMVRNGDVVEAHQWSVQSSSWQKIGEVVDAVGSDRKQLYQGKEYDYVFDVDIQDGVPPLKLPYNASENPYQAALRFLQTNDLPESYIDEVVKFIERNTAGVQLGGGANEYVDPYTGASRYTSNSSSVPTTALQPSSAYMDPFTGASRYSGAASSSASAPAAPAPVTLRTLPVRTTLPFKQANVAAMRSKLFQLNESFLSDISTTVLALGPSEIQKLDRVFAFLTSAMSSHNTPPPELSDIEMVLQLMTRWPESQRFPVLDLARLISGYAPSIVASPSTAPAFIAALLEASEWSSTWPDPLPKQKETNFLLFLRTIANMFQPGLKDWRWAQRLFEQLAQVPSTRLNKTQWVALATVVFNYSCVCLEQLDTTVRPFHIQLTLKILQSEAANPEGVYRALVTLGNIAFAAQTKALLDPATIDAIKVVATLIQSQATEDRSKVVLAEIGQLLA